MTTLKLTDKELEALRMALAVGRLNTQKLIEDPNYLSNLRKLVNSKGAIVRIQKKLGFDNEWDGNTFMPKNEEDYYDISF